MSPLESGLRNVDEPGYVQAAGRWQLPIHHVQASGEPYRKPAREHGGRGYKVPNGGVYSSVVDLAGYVIALMGRSDHFTDTLLTRLYERPPGITSEDGRGTEAYGLGIRMHVDESGNILSANHGGTVSGYRAWIQFQPVEGYGVVLLRNYNQGANELSTIADEFLADLEPTLPRRSMLP